MKELDDLITYIENELIGEHKDIEIIDEAIKKYAELYHKKQLSIDSVNQQRELLLDFADLVMINDCDLHTKEEKALAVDKYIKGNL